MAGLEDSWQIVGHSSRNSLLDALDAAAKERPRRHSVALIDARVESGDIDQVGFRVCETIKRHAHLWKATRPLIWVDRLSEANRLYAKRVGATAIVDDDWVDRTDATGLGEALSWALGQSPSGIDQPTGAFRVVSDREIDPEAEASERDAMFERRFGRAPGELGFTLLWGMAGAVELSFLYWFCEQEGIASDRQVQRACERLQEAMRPEREHLDRPEPTNAEIARRFLTEVVPAEPDPLADIAWPGIEYVQQIFGDADLRALAYLEPGSETLLESFFASYLPEGISARERYEAILGACKDVADDIGAGSHATRRQIQRACHALDDARLDALSSDAGHERHP